MNLFLDTSVLLAAAGSNAGASHEIFRRAAPNGWSLLTTPYVIDEVIRNLDRLPQSAAGDWSVIGRQLSVRPDVLTLDRPAVFGPSKDRPVLFSALAWADVLLTLDQGDFGHLMTQGFYGLRVLRPGTFLEEQRPRLRWRVRPLCDATAAWPHPPADCRSADRRSAAAGLPDASDRFADSVRRTSPIGACDLKAYEIQVATLFPSGRPGQ